MRKKLPAFTLMELLIGMIISSIVISFGYATYSLIYKQFLSYKAVKKEIVMVAQLNSILQNDFLNSEMILFNEGELIIKRESNLSVIYDFNDSIVLRKDIDVIDTFKIAPKITVVGFVFPEQRAVVKKFSFDAQLFGETEHFIFEKKYSAETLINIELKLKSQ